MSNIYATPNSDITPTSDEIQYSGFWVRFLATMIDSVLAMLLIFSLGYMIYGAIYFQSTEFIQGWADVFISYVLPFVLTILFWYFKSATPGKMILGVKIVDSETLGKPSSGKLIGRYLSYYISVIPLCLGFLWVAWDPKKQAWHDKIAGTLVIKEK